MTIRKSEGFTLKRKLIAGKKALQLGVSGAIGGLLGSLIAEPIYLHLTSGVAGTFFSTVITTAIWFAIVGGAIATAICAGYYYYLKRRLQIAHAIKQVAVFGLVAGAVSGAFAEFIYTGVGPNPLLQLICWGIAGGLLGLSLSFRLPNLGLWRGLAGGLVGGLLGWFPFALLAYVLSETLGRLSGIACIGFCIGLMLIVVETLFSKAWLLINYDDGEERTLNIGREPLTIGSDEARAIIWVRDAPPLALRFTLEQGQIICEDVSTGTKKSLQPGHHKRVGNCTITVGAADQTAALETTPEVPIEEDFVLLPNVQQSNDSQSTAHLVQQQDGTVISMKAFPFTIGRELSNRLVLTDPECSRYHASISQVRDEWGQTHYHLEDLGSANGTYVGSQRLAQHQQYKLTPGSLIRIGGAEWTFECNKVEL